MKKLFTIILVAALVLTGLSAGNHHTVPLNDRAYDIIRTAELKGIVPVQSDVKPYNLDKVINLLNEIRNSGTVSAGEIAEIDRLLTGYTKSYGVYPSNAFRDVLKKGNLAYNFDRASLTIGVKASSDNRAGLTLDKDKIISSRNLATAYVAGDISDYVSYDINFSFVLDKLDTFAYNFNDFEFTSDGQYFVGGLNDIGELTGQEGIGLGLSTSSEVTSTFLDGKVSIQAGAFKRDWGPGLNNLGLSGSAQKFTGIQIQIEPSDWFRFSSLVGSLGISCFERAYPLNNSTGSYKDFLPASSFNGYITPGSRFDNNFSIHRAEFTFGQFKFNLFESSVWKKRFELSYISPVSIYWIAQNFQGDYDSLIGGFDLSYTFKDIGRVYAAFVVDEFKKIGGFFKHPRNILAMQGGFEFPSRFGEYGRMTIQATYVPPFFGSHHDQTRQDWGNGYYSVTYANGGKTLSYPVNPDTLELMVAFSCGFGNGWNFETKLKDQMQSAQYTNHESYDRSRDGDYVNAGLSVNDALYYPESEDYADKEFFKHIWKNTTDLDITVSKKFEDIPLAISLGANIIVDWTRNFTAKIEQSAGENADKYNMGAYNFGAHTEMGDWNTPFIRFLGKIAFTVYY